MAMKKNPFLGRWRITEMEQWDKDFIDQEEEGFVEFGNSGSGEFHFGNVEGSMHGEIETVEGKPRFEFTWNGSAEMDEANGRGCAEVQDDGKLYGKLFFHEGDKSWFKAKRKK